MFSDLYNAAVEREHPLMWEIQRLLDSGVCDSFLATVRLAKSLQESGLDFAEAIDEIAMRRRMRIRPMPPCPACQSQHCAGAMFTYYQPSQSLFSSFCGP